MANKKILVIGGSAAGPKAAARARRMDEQAEITIIQKNPYLSMASCGYPYYIGGGFDDRNMLLCTPTGVVRDPQFYLKAKKITARVQTEAIAIDRSAKKVRVKDLTTDQEEELSYDSLILATGATPIRPPVPGNDLEGITTLQSMEDADFLRKARDSKQVKKAIVIGGGLIGIEACEALRLSGIETTIIEKAPQILSFLDWEMAKLVENYVRSQNIDVHLNNGVKAFLGEGKLIAVELANGHEIACDLAVVAIGVKPNSTLAQLAGLKIGETGGIVVDEYMRTSDPAIFAAGDCVEIKNLLTNKKIHAPYGDLANLEGRVAGENAVLGQNATFPGSIQTGICRIFDYVAGTTGLSEKSARQNGKDVVTVVNASQDKPGFMTSKLLISKMVADLKTRQILGVQCIGPGDVSKQIAIWATAIKGGLTVEDMINADLPYAPPFSLAIDHSIATAHLMQNKMDGRLKGVSANEALDRLKSDNPPFLLDVRDPDEHNAMHLGIGEVLIPLGALRERLEELPEDKEREIMCYCKISLRGYEAALALEANGWKNVRVMEGGIMAWPFKRKK